jgi:O-antigen/teichoic acid export membrane protein
LAWNSRSQLFPQGTALAISGVSQAISSLTSFAITLYLVGHLEKSDFGLYSLGYAALLVVSAILTALFSVQYLVNNPDCPQHGKRAFALHYVAAVGVVGVAVVLATTGGLLIMELFPPVAQDGALDAVLPVAVAILGFSVRDMVARVAFVERREWVVLAGTLTVAISAVLAFAATRLLGSRLDAATALTIIAATQLTGAGLIVILQRLPWREFRLSGLRQVFGDAWRGGRWHALTSIVHSIRTQAHNLLLLPLVGLSTLAEVNAGRVLLTPAVLAIPPLYQVLMPRLAEQARGGAGGVSGPVTLILGGLIVFSVGYSACLLSILDWLLPFTLGGDYGTIEPVIQAWCVFIVFVAARNGLSMGLEVRKDFRAIFQASSIAALVAVILSVVLALLWQGVGAVAALAAAEAVLCLLLFRALNRLPEDN